MGEKKLTRKEWAAAFGLDYATMARALNKGRHARRVPNELFDEATVRSALVKKLNDERMKHMEKAARIERRMNEVREKKIDYERV